jgi:hypothetical protein
MDEIEILFTNEKESSYLCTLTDMNGNSIFQKQIQTSNGESKHSFPIKNMAAGMYYLQISNKANKHYTFKILKK